MAQPTNEEIIQQLTNSTAPDQSTNNAAVATPPPPPPVTSDLTIAKARLAFAKSKSQENVAATKALLQAKQYFKGFTSDLVETDPLGTVEDPYGLNANASAIEEPVETEPEKDLNLFNLQAKDALIESIYNAEGGEDARIPFGMFTKAFERRVASGDKPSKAEVKDVVYNHLNSHIQRWESGGTRKNVANPEKRGLVDANLTHESAIDDEGNWNPRFLEWYGEIYAPSSSANENLRPAEDKLNPNWVTNVSRGLGMEEPAQGIVSAYAPADEETELGQPYVIQAGDTLSEIAQRQGISLEELQRLNPQTVGHETEIQPGQELVLKEPIEQVAGSGR